jgi:cytochrome c biogenesis protein CcdA
MAEGWTGLLGLGFLFGLKHALDADHLVAISSIIGENRRTRGAAAVGLWWGIGHTLSLLAAGIAVLLLRLEIPPGVENGLEIGVAAMIIVLGGRIVVRILGRSAALRFARHRHGTIEHIHPLLRFTDPTRHDHTTPRRSPGMRSLLVGIIHGLAGSAALMLLVLAQISEPALGLLYIIVFGLGSVVGMMAMSTLFWLPFLATASRFGRLETGLRLAAGIGSVAFGILMFVEHLR